jgi:hypothetical protein
MFKSPCFNVSWLGLLCGVLFLGGLLLHHGRPIGEAVRPTGIHSTPVGAPARLLEAGPYGIDVRSTFTRDKITVNLNASRLYMKKANTLGFSNALLKKMVARDLTIVVKRKGDVILSLTKAYQEMPADMSAFTIDRPHILHPSDMAPPDRVLIEKDNQRILFWHGAEKKIWDLSAG